MWYNELAKYIIGGSFGYWDDKLITSWKYLPVYGLSLGPIIWILIYWLMLKLWKD